jgi:hypothetical protein
MVRLLGVHQKQQPADTAHEFAGHRGTRIFLPDVIHPRDLVRKLKIQCADTWAANQVAVWSFKPHPADVRNGKWRKPVEDLARYLKANPGNKTAIVIWHEPENDVPLWFKRPEDFVQLFNTVHDWIVAIHPDAWTCHAALAYRYGIKTGGITDGAAKRWRTKARVNTIDAYSGRSFALDQTLPEHPGYQRWRRIVAPAGPWGVTERGWTCEPKDHPVRAAVIAREFAWLKALPPAERPVVYMIWSTSGVEGDPGLILDEHAKTAVRKGFQAVYKTPPT